MACVWFGSALPIGISLLQYQIRQRDWDKPGNIKGYIAQLNQLRRANTALQQTSNLRFAQVDNSAGNSSGENSETTSICGANSAPIS